MRRDKFTPRSCDGPPRSVNSHLHISSKHFLSHKTINTLWWLIIHTLALSSLRTSFRKFWRTLRTLFSDGSSYSFCWLVFNRGLTQRRKKETFQEGANISNRLGIVACNLLFMMPERYVVRKSFTHFCCEPLLAFRATGIFHVRSWAKPPNTSASTEETKHFIIIYDPHLARSFARFAEDRSN